MKFSFAPFRRDFASPFVYGNRSLEAREGIALRLEANGQEYFSEASPLPGHSRETLDHVSEFFSATTAKPLLAHLEAEAAQNFLPSVAFALEGLAAQRRLAGGGGFSPVSTNALVAWSNGQSVLAEIFRLQQLGYDTVKLKVTNQNAAELLEVVQALEGKEMVVRLDGNRALREEVVGEFLGGLARNGALWVEYFEEPFVHWRLPALRESPVPLAADECAADPRFWPALLKQEGGPDFYVLKPTVSGGLSSLAKRATLLLNAGKRVVYTTSLEAEPGRRSLLAFLGEKTAVETGGLSTGFLFKENFLADLPMHSNLPKIESLEQNWLHSLPWKKIP